MSADAESLKFNVITHLDSINPSYYRYALGRTPKTRLRRKQPLGPNSKDSDKQPSTESVDAQCQSSLHCDQRNIAILLSGEPADKINLEIGTTRPVSSQSSDAPDTTLQSIFDNNDAGNYDVERRPATASIPSNHETSITLNRRSVDFADATSSSSSLDSLDHELRDFSPNCDAIAQSDSDDQCSLSGVSRTSNTVQTVNKSAQPRVTTRKKRRLPLGELILVPNRTNDDEAHLFSSPRSSDDDSIEDVDAENHLHALPACKKRTNVNKNPLKPLSILRKCIIFENVAKRVSFDSSAYKLPKPPVAALTHSYDGPFGGDGFRGQELALLSKRVNGRKYRSPSPIPGKCLTFFNASLHRPASENFVTADTGHVDLSNYADSTNLPRDDLYGIALSEVSSSTNDVIEVMQEMPTMCDSVHIEDVSDDEQTHTPHPLQASLYASQRHLRRAATMDTQGRSQLSTVGATLPDSPEEDSKCEGSVHSNWESSIGELSKALYIGKEGDNDENHNEDEDDNDGNHDDNNKDDTKAISMAQDPKLRPLNLPNAAPTDRRTQTLATLPATEHPPRNLQAFLDPAPYFQAATCKHLQPTTSPPKHPPPSTSAPPLPSMHPVCTNSYPLSHPTGIPNTAPLPRTSSHAFGTLPDRRRRRSAIPRPATRTRQSSLLDPRLPLEPPFRPGSWR